MVYKDFFVYTTNYWDFCRGFQLTQKIVDVARNRIRGFNFNRYGRNGEGSPCPDPREHITVRLDVEENGVIQKVEAQLEEMRNRGEIDDWRREEDTQYDIKPMREYPPVYHTAHETSTACAFRFYEKLKNNPSEFRNFQGNKVQYLLMFLPLWLKYSGFALLNGIMVNTSVFIDNLAKSCAESFKTTVDKNRVTGRYTFAERLVHLFLNCICVPNGRPLVGQEYQIIARIATDLGFTTFKEFFDMLDQSLVDC